MFLDMPLRVLLAMWILRRIELRRAKVVKMDFPAKELERQAAIFTFSAGPFLEKKGVLQTTCWNIVTKYAQTLIDEADRLNKLHVVTTGVFREGDKE